MKYAVTLLTAALAFACVKEQTTTTTATPAPAPVPAPEVSLSPAAAASATPGRNVAGFPPLDQASNDPTFAAYRDQLRAAVKAKDWNALQKMIDPNIRTSFGGTGGTSDFKARLDDKGMWEELDTILAMGGTFRELDRGEKQFCAPYVYSAWPEDRDSFESLAVVNRGARLKDKPEDSAPTTAALEYEIVDIGPDDPMRKGEQDPKWRQITTGEGLKGYVRAEDVRSSVDYRACFSKRSGEWKMDLLVAGD